MSEATSRLFTSCETEADRKQSEHDAREMLTLKSHEMLLNRTDGVEAECIDYAQMIERAKKISPLAEVRKIEDTDEWEIFIPTNLCAALDLPVSFKDTPAWNAHNTRDEKYDTHLASWGHYSRFDNLPIEGIAEFYNVAFKLGAKREEELNKLNKESGLANGLLQNISSPSLEIWRENTARAREIADAFVDEEYKALRVKWRV